MGLLLFPQWRFLRIIGRIAFPLYAYCIAEGFRYTRNRAKYFLRIFLLGLLCQIVYTIADRTLYLGILIVFSMSLIIMYFADCAKTASRGEVSDLNRRICKFMGKDKPLNNDADKTISAAVCAASVIGVLFLCMKVQVDYGFFGVMLPVFTFLFDDRPRKLVMFTAALLALCIDMTGSSFFIQFWSLLTVPILAAYNGQPGKYRMKYFFYIFYPVHLIILYGIQMLLS